MLGINYDLEQREAEGNPIKIGMVGIGQMGIDVIAETKMMKGVEIVAAADISVERARDGYRAGLIEAEVVEVNSAEEADAAVRAGKRIASGDYRLVTDMKTVDVMLEATGIPEIGTRAALRAARNGQHLAMMNVEADITVGPILNWYAKKKGVIYALAAGDEPAA